MKALQICLLFLTEKQRRHLQILLRFMRRVSKNRVLKLDSNGMQSNLDVVKYFNLISCKFRGQVNWPSWDNPKFPKYG